MKKILYILLYSLLKRYSKDISPYIKSFIGEPLFWGIVIGVLIISIIGYIGYVLEHKKKRNLDKKNICQYCKGYEELVTKTKGEKKNTICPHCCGTGWTVEG